MRSLAVLITAVALAGCAGSSLLDLKPPPAPRTHAGAIYLARLGAEQAQVVAAERAIPHRPHTPAQLARSIMLLAAAIHDEATGLAAIEPPQDVAGLHRRLVRITRAYARQLVVLAHRARDPQLEVGAANAMAGATELASASFTTTVRTIRERLAR